MCTLGSSFTTVREAEIDQHPFMTPKRGMGQLNSDGDRWTFAVSTEFVLLDVDETAQCDMMNPNPPSTGAGCYNMMDGAKWILL